MTDEPKTSEQPSGHLRWFQPEGAFDREGPRRLQQLWYITTYHGAEVEPEQTEVWRDVPVVSE